MNENDIYKFCQFVNENGKNNTEVFKFLRSKAKDIKSKKLPHMMNDLIECKPDERTEYIEDILLEIGDCVNGEEFNWVKSSLEELDLGKKVKASNDKGKH